MIRRPVLIVMLGGLAGLAGCSHSCVPPGWYQAQPVTPLQRPPGAKPIHFDTRYEIPGGSPAGKPNRGQACLVTPPDAVTTPAAASTAKPRSK